MKKAAKVRGRSHPSGPDLYTALSLSVGSGFISFFLLLFVSLFFLSLSLVLSSAERKGGERQEGGQEDQEGEGERRGGGQRGEPL